MAERARMEITAALAIALALLTQALDEPGADIAETVQLLAADAKMAVHSYLGVTVENRGVTTGFALTAMEDAAARTPIQSSMMLTLPRGEDDGAGVIVILYASNAGAFVDLAADLSWLTSAAVTDFVLDEHLVVHPNSVAAIQFESVINQAVGVLIGRGMNPAQASLELDRLAADAGTSRHDAASALLAAATRPDATA